MANETKIKARNLTEIVRKLTLSIFIFAAVGYFVVSCAKTEETTVVPAVQPAISSTEKPLVEIDPNADFSEFMHLNPQHQRLPCTICHIMQDNSPTPTFSGHIPCASCHVQQFADNSSAICLNCHSNAESGELKRFPPLRNFSAAFDHAKHLNNANCADCHRSSRRGVAFSIPSRQNAHRTCFQCHQADAMAGEVDIGSCGTCHQSGKPPRFVPETAKAFDLSFSHSKHKISCNECHKVKSGNGRGNQVTAPVAAMHDAPKNGLNCATCHNNRRAFGGDDFFDCRRCHLGPNFQLPGTK